MSIRAILTPESLLEADQLLTTIGPTFRTLLVERVMALSHWTAVQAKFHISGVFQMNNIMDDRHTHVEQIRLIDITTPLIVSTFDNAMAGSNPNLNLFQVVFAFWINPLSYNVGAGTTTPLKDLSGIHKKTAITYQTAEGEPISCAALAIAHDLAKEGYYGTPFKSNPFDRICVKRFLIHAKELQTSLRWGLDVSFSELPQFVAVHPTYRLVVIQPSFKNSRISDWKGSRYVQDEEQKIIHLYFHPETLHYYGVKAPMAFIRKQKNSRSYLWCHVCSQQYIREGPGCACNDPEHAPVVVRKRVTCAECGETHAKNTKHRCNLTECHFCHMFFKKGRDLPNFGEHRCPLFKPSKSLKPRFEGENDFPLDAENKMEPPENKSTQLWVYDLESCIVPTLLTANVGSLDFELSDDAKFMLDDEGAPRCFEARRYDQIPNLVVYQNVFTGELRQTSSMDEFLQFMLTSNGGRNTCMAHNGSGYDSRLVLESLTKLVPEGTQIAPLMRGGKIMNLTIGSTRFTDTMMHLPGSLKSLAKDFLSESEVVLEKGYFPHLFNSPTNYDYIGPIPAKCFFDLSFCIGNDKDMTEFNTFYDSWACRTDWNFSQQLVDYCINDVKVLAEIVRIHHEKCTEVLYKYQPKLSVSPWHFTTAAGYVHALFLADISFDVDIDVTDEDEIKKLVNKGWCALQAEEYYFARSALRGGRTETVRYHYQAEEGQKIKDLDVMSMYPYCQIGKEIVVGDVTIPILYPVGYPQIEVFDPDYYPCNLHWKTPLRICACRADKKRQYTNKKIKIFEDTDQPGNLHAFVNRFFGIIMVDVTPPTDLYNPVLPVFDEDEGKCLFALEPIIAKSFTSVELRVAIRAGYVVTKIYRADRYKSAPSLWTPLMRELYKLKLYNSQEAKPNAQNIFNETTEEWQARQKATHLERFGLDIDFEGWGKRPAAKLTSKVLINSAWGKHAESVDHPQTMILDDSMTDEGYHFYSSLMERNNVVKQITTMTSTRTLFKYEASRLQRYPDLHKGYLPCAVFVPMYGRMMLWNELGKLKERVIMCDTDSVKYIADENGYNITPGDCLGDWEEEPTQMVEFVSLGPKTYGQRFADGSSTFKCKGVSLKRAHGDIMNFQVAKKILLEGAIVRVPQMTFDYKLGHGISTRKFVKNLEFKSENLKGNYDPRTTKLYPFGYINK